MNSIGSIVAFSALLACLLCFGATALHGIVTGRLYYEPNCPPIIVGERPAKFFALLTFDLAVMGLLVLGCMKVGSVLF